MKPVHRLAYGNDFVRIQSVKDFDLSSVFDNGQCFRWDKTGTGHYTGVAMGRVLEVLQEGNDLVLVNTNPEEFRTIWYPYFTLDIDYGEIKEILGKDPFLKKAIQYAPGLRLLRQDFLETMFSFLLSSNNNIGRIKKIIGCMCHAAGNPIIYKEKEYHTFPDLYAMGKLTCDDFLSFGAGYRSKYLIHTINTLHGTGIDQNALRSGTLEQARKTLQGFKGIGMKVADCILLYSGTRYDCFPTDVWVKRIMTEYMGAEKSIKDITTYASAVFGPYAGFAQQYLFHYIRNEATTI